MRSFIVLSLLFFTGCSKFTPQATTQHTEQKTEDSKKPISFNNKIFHGATGIYSYTINKKYKVKLPSDFARKAPIWYEGQPNPPLAAAQAIRLAVTKRQELVKDSDDFSWRLIRAILVPTNEGRWYWEIVFEYHIQAGGSTGTPENLRLIVTMDGIVIEPEIIRRNRSRG